MTSNCWSTFRYGWCGMDHPYDCVRQVSAHTAWSPHKLGNSLICGLRHVLCVTGHVVDMAGKRREAFNDYCNSVQLAFDFNYELVVLRGVEARVCLVAHLPSVATSYWRARSTSVFGTCRSPRYAVPARDVLWHRVSLMWRNQSQVEEFRCPP